MNIKTYSITFMAVVAVSYLYAQVQVDQPIELTGGAGQRSVQGLEAPVNGTDAVNKDYVDNAVSAGGGGNPVAISAESALAMTFGDALRYCKALTEGGNSDWRLPDFDELTYALSQGGLTVSSDASTNYVWFRSLPGNGSSTTFWPMMRLSDGDLNGISTSSPGSTAYARCVR